AQGPVLPWWEQGSSVTYLAGINTVLEDNPALTTRIPNGRNPVRIVLDSTLKIPLDYQLVTDNEAETWIFTSRAHDETKKKELEQAGVRVFVTNRENTVDPHEVVERLGEEGISSVMIEGGGNIHASFLENQLIDKVVLYIAPKLVGGKDAPTFLEGTGVKLMKDAVELNDVAFIPVGKDLKYIGYPTYTD